MSNMGYCRFQNTLKDLEDCYYFMDDPELSIEEKKARKHLIKICGIIPPSHKKGDMTYNYTLMCRGIPIQL